MQSCQYCQRPERFRSLLFEVCTLPCSTVFLCKDQTLPGRCTIMYKDHCAELCEIPEKERNEYIKDVCTLQETLMELYRPAKLNTAYYGDKCPHVHFTICPKYEDKLGWGGPFVNFPPEEHKVTLTPEQYQSAIENIRTLVLKKRGIPPENHVD